jgi:hypothetical protein
VRDVAWLGDQGFSMFYDIGETLDDAIENKEEWRLQEYGETATEWVCPLLLI